MAEFIFPAVGVAVVAAVMAQMLSGNHSASSLGYVALLGGILVVLSLAGALRAVLNRARNAKAAPRGVGGEELRSGYRGVALLFVLTAAVILTMQSLGYLLVMSVYLVAVGRMLYRGSWRVTLGTSLGMILLVHVMFVGQLDLALPTGSLWRGLQASWFG